VNSRNGALKTVEFEARLETLAFFKAEQVSPSTAHTPASTFFRSDISDDGSDGMKSVFLVQRLDVVKSVALPAVFMRQPNAVSVCSGVNAAVFILPTLDCTAYVITMFV
jgi:hypothetical protein